MTNKNPKSSLKIKNKNPKSSLKINITNGKVHMDEFSVFTEYGISYCLTTITSENKALMCPTYNREVNKNAKEYGAWTYDRYDKDGCDAIIERKNQWIERGDENNVLRAFLVSKKCYDNFDNVDYDNLPVGVINLGVSQVVFDSMPMLEGGVLFIEGLISKAEQTSVMNAVYIDYLSTVYNEGIVDSKAFFYTISITNQQCSAFKESHLHQLGNDDSLQHKCEAAVLDSLAGSDRFSIDKNSGNVYEGKNNVKKEVFFNILDDSSCDALSNTPEDSTELQI
jgi:hypothetical protein